MGFGFVDLFAGIGGFHAALSRLGGQGLLAAEIDSAAARTYARNWGLVPLGDVRSVARDAERLVPPHALLAGGFPCQPFSKSGLQRGINELRGQMFGEILKILEVRKPPVVVLENVRNLAGPRQRHVWEAIVAGLREVGYRTSTEPCVVSPHFLGPALGGGPQSRERIYILGTYVGRERAQSELVEPLLTRGPTGDWDPQLWDIERTVLQEEHMIPERDQFLLSDTERAWLGVWNDFLAKTRHVTLPGFPMWSMYWRDDATVDTGAPAWKQRIEAQNIEFYTDNRAVIRRWLRANPDLRSFPLSRQKFEWQAGRSPRDFRACLVQFRPSGIRVKAPTHAPALVAIGQTPVVGPRLRRLTVREAARLQGFPDVFDFGDQAPTTTYRQLGNAVHVGLAYWVIRQHVLNDAVDIAFTGALGEGLVAAVESAPKSISLREWRDSPLASHSASANSQYTTRSADQFALDGAML